MPNRFKCTIYFSGPDHGASEAFYIEDASADIQNAITRFQPVVNKRAPLLGSDWKVKCWSCHLIRDDAGNKVLRKGRPIKGTISGTAAQPCAETDVSLEVLFSTADGGANKLLSMCGPWHGLFPNDDTINRGFANWQSVFDAWVAALRTARVGWVGVAGTQQSDIIDYAFDPTTGHTTYTLAPGGITWPSLSKPHRVSVEFPLLRSPLDGVQIVIPLPSGTEAITAKPRPAAPFIFPGTMKLQSKTFVDWNAPIGQQTQGTCVAQNPVRRKRGRPYFTSRGAGPRVVRW